MPNIPPTVARMVYFRPADSDSIKASDAPLAAQIAAVNGDGTVNLGVLDHLGKRHDRQNVPVVQQGDEPPEQKGYCHWMDYQLGQAAKTEAAEAASAASAEGDDGEEKPKKAAHHAHGKKHK